MFDVSAKIGERNGTVSIPFIVEYGITTSLCQRSFSLRCGSARVVAYAPNALGLDS